MMKIKDSNGDKVRSSVRAYADGTFGAMTYWGSHHVTNVREYFYSSRITARRADISDDIGKCGRVA